MGRGRLLWRRCKPGYQRRGTFRHRHARSGESAHSMLLGARIAVWEAPRRNFPLRWCACRCSHGRWPATTRCSRIIWTQTRRQSTSIDVRQSVGVVHSWPCRGGFPRGSRRSWERNAGRLVCVPDRPPLSRPAETQSGRRVSLRQTQLEGTCHPCTTYSRVASPGASRQAGDARTASTGCAPISPRPERPGALVRGSHRNPHRRRQTPPRDGAGSAFAALIPIPDTEWCTVSSPRSGSNASAGYPQ